MEKQALQLVLLVAGVLVAEMARLVGRTVFGLLAGLRPSRVVIGAGPLLVRRRIGGVAVALRAVPLVIGNDWMPPVVETRMRLRLWLLTAGGPVGGVATIALLGAFGVHWTHTLPGLWPWQAVLGGIVLQLFGRLVPISLLASGKKVPSDGLQLWTIPRMAQASIDGAFVHSYLAAASDEVLNGDPKLALAYCERGIALCTPVDVRVFRYTQGAAHGKLGHYAEAKDCIAESLAADVPEPLHGAALNDWSWYAFCLRGEADLRLADRRSAEALGVRPKSSGIQGTRGAILLWRGRVTQAIPLLERSLQTAPSARSRATEAALLAMAYASRGESVRAQEMIDRARRWNRNERLLIEAGRYVRAAAASLRVLRAARGSRALLVEPDAIELLGGVTGDFDDPVKVKAAAVTRCRLTLSEIDEVSVVGRSSGAARLVVRHARGVWRLPLSVGDLTWARMLADDVMNNSPLPEATPPSVPVTNDRVTKWLPAIGVAVMLMIMLGVPAARHLVSITLLSAVIAIVVRPGVASALAVGTAVVFKMPPYPVWYGAWHFQSQGDGWLAREGMLAAVGVLSLTGAWFAARERHPRAGLRVTVGLLVTSLAIEVLLAVVLLVRGQFFHPRDLVSASAALLAVLAWWWFGGRSAGTAHGRDL